MGWISWSVFSTAVLNALGNHGMLTRCFPKSFAVWDTLGVVLALPILPWFKSDRRSGRLRVVLSLPAWFGGKRAKHDEEEDESITPERWSKLRLEQEEADSPRGEYGMLGLNVDDSWARPQSNPLTKELDAPAVETPAKLSPQLHMQDPVQIEVEPLRAAVTSEQTVVPLRGAVSSEQTVATVETLIEIAEAPAAAPPAPENSQPAHVPPEHVSPLQGISGSWRVPTEPEVPVVEAPAQVPSQVRMQEPVQIIESAETPPLSAAPPVAEIAQSAPVSSEQAPHPEGINGSLQGIERIGPVPKEPEVPVVQAAAQFLSQFRIQEPVQIEAEPLHGAVPSAQAATPVETLIEIGEAPPPIAASPVAEKAASAPVTLEQAVPLEIIHGGLQVVEKIGLVPREAEVPAVEAAAQFLSQFRMQEPVQIEAESSHGAVPSAQAAAPMETLIESAEAPPPIAAPPVAEKAASAPVPSQQAVPLEIIHGGLQVVEQIGQAPREPEVPAVQAAQFLSQFRMQEPVQIEAEPLRGAVPSAQAAAPVETLIESAQAPPPIAAPPVAEKAPSAPVSLDQAQPLEAINGSLQDVEKIGQVSEPEVPAVEAARFLSQFRMQEPVQIEAEPLHGAVPSAQAAAPVETLIESAEPIGPLAAPPAAESALPAPVSLDQAQPLETINGSGQGVEKIGHVPEPEVPAVEAAAQFPPQLPMQEPVQIIESAEAPSPLAAPPTPEIAQSAPLSTPSSSEQTPAAGGRDNFRRNLEAINGSWQGIEKIGQEIEQWFDEQRREVFSHMERHPGVREHTLSLSQQQDFLKDRLTAVDAKWLEIRKAALEICRWFGDTPC